MEPCLSEERHGFGPVGQNGAGSSCLADLVLEPDSVQRLRLLHTHNSMLGEESKEPTPEREASVHCHLQHYCAYISIHKGEGQVGCRSALCPTHESASEAIW